jgi:hypothetical protein
MYKKNGSSRLIVSFLTLRRTVGVLGVLLPWLLVLVCHLLGTPAGIEDSISAYYGTAARDVLVGVLFVIALFLFAYRGYEPRDDIAGDLACIFALGVALFPATSQSAAIRSVHFVCSALMFLILAYFSIFLFTKTGKDDNPTPRKKTRNKVYVVCGVIMLLCIALVPVSYALVKEPTGATKPVFWLEALALTAFGVSWFVKGETLLKDRKAAL